ncbi:MAG TPA: cysteine desulfurase family protein [Verrucomicrobiae bacterium]|nr:cysteine desulfurase family protein [Verrucomicrobiae bacterium]
MVYLDYNATTPVDPRVAEAMWPYLRELFGNPSSLHIYGVNAKDAVETARAQVAGLLGCHADEIVFTSGGSESNNTAIKGVAFTLRQRGYHVITTTIEHSAVISPCKFLERLGFFVTYLPVDRYGMVSTRDVEAAIRPTTILISIMHANNEVGTIQPIAAIGALARSRGILMHTDAAQSAGKIPVRVDDLNVDLLTLAGHKFYAPKGVGALYIRRGVEIDPLIHGASHESGRRAGTENVPLIVALGKACELATNELDSRWAHVVTLRDYLFDNLKKMFGDKLHVNGHPTERVPNTLNVSFEGYTAPELLQKIPEVAASTGSACHAHSLEMSHVLQAMGVPERVGFGAVRFSLGQWTTASDVDYLLELLQLRVLK